MTIAVAIRTGSAVVFAADSKVTTSGIVGIEEDGSPRWLEQTYDNATKMVHDRNRILMGMVAGHANIGQVAATDFLSTLSMKNTRSAAAEDQDEALRTIVDSMVTLKRSYWETTQVPPEKWPGPTILLAAPSPTSTAPRVWRVNLHGADSDMSEMLTEPGIHLEGSYAEVFTLLYAFNPDMMEEIRQQLGVDEARFRDAVRSRRVLAPIDKLSLWGMPIQDAMDLAVFLASVQVEMDRFLPGTAACGGPIDVMVLQMAPEPGIVAHPGKALHHPRDHR